MLEIPLLEVSFLGIPFLEVPHLEVPSLETQRQIDIHRHRGTQRQAQVDRERNTERYAEEDIVRHRETRQTHSQLRLSKSIPRRRETQRESFSNARNSSLRSHFLALHLRFPILRSSLETQRRKHRHRGTQRQAQVDGRHWETPRDISRRKDCETQRDAQQEKTFQIGISRFTLLEVSLLGLRIS